MSCMCIESLHTYVQTCVYVYKYIQVHLCVQIHTYIHTYTRVHVHTEIEIKRERYDLALTIRPFIYTSIAECIHTCKDTHTHTHTCSTCAVSSCALALTMRLSTLSVEPIAASMPLSVLTESPDFPSFMYNSASASHSADLDGCLRTASCTCEPSLSAAARRLMHTKHPKTEAH